MVCAALAVALTGSGWLPGRVALPLDLLADTGAWKRDPAARVPPSNSLLSDAVLMFDAWDVEARRLLGSGELPWRNRYAADGAALWANPQSALLSPFTWPRLLFGERGWALCLALKLFVAGFGMALWSRALGAGSRDALLSGALFELSGATLLYAPFPLANVVVSLPLLGFAATSYLRSPRRLGLVAVTACAALATAGGHPETLVPGVATVALVLFVELRGVARRESWTRVAGAAAAGFLLLGVTLVPFALELSRSAIVQERAATAPGPFRWVALAGTLLPGYLGTPIAGELDLSGAIAGGENLIVRSASYVGAVPFLLLIAMASKRARAERWLLATAATALLVSWRTPGLVQIVHATPIVGWIAPEHFVVVFVLLAALLAPRALASWTSSRTARASAVVLLVAGIALFAVGASVALPPLRPTVERAAHAGIERLRERGLLRQPAAVYAARFDGYLERGRWTALRRAALPGLCWAVSGFGLLAIGRRRELVVGACAAELLAFGLGFLPSVPREKIPPAAPFVADLHRLDPRGGAVIAAAVGLYPANLGTLERIRQVDAYDVLESRERAARLAMAGYSPLERGFPETLTAEQVRALSVLDVDYFLSRAPSAGLELAGGDAPPGVGLYRLPDARPSPLPENSPPEGLPGGVAVSVAGLALAALSVLRASGQRAIPV